MRYSDSETAASEIEDQLLELEKRIETQQAEIERLNARIKDYQDACSQKQEIING